MTESSRLGDRLAGVKVRPSFRSARSTLTRPRRLGLPESRLCGWQGTPVSSLDGIATPDISSRGQRWGRVKELAHPERHPSPHGPFPVLPRSNLPAIHPHDLPAKEP